MSSILRSGLSAHGLQCVRDDRILFDQLDFHIDAGQVMQIEGHNGSGKTSLLRILCGLTLPTEGEVCWQGESIERSRETYQAALNYVGHHHGVKGELTPEENLRVAKALCANPTDISLFDALEQVGLYGFEDVPARTLSAGQQRRVGLARLLISKAPLWILDEPFTALDKKGIACIESLIENHATQGGIVVLTSHHPVKNPRLERLQLAA